MRWGKRGDPPSSQTDPISTFWEWWLAEGSTSAELILMSGRSRKFADEVSRRVDVINPELTWELAPGRVAQHALVVSASGVAGPRRDAERWFTAAPQTSGTWEYHPSRRANPDALDDRLVIAGKQFDLAAFRFAIAADQDRLLLDVDIFHPHFASMPTEVKQHVQFLVLDQLLGEDDVVRWIGAIELADSEPGDSVDGRGLRAEVESLAQRTRPTLRLVNGHREGRPFVAAIARPLRWIDHPLLDARMDVVLPYDAEAREGLPTVSDAHDILGFQRGLSDALSERGFFAAYRAINGAAVVRFYVDQVDSAAQQAVRAAARTWPGSHVTMSIDQGWEQAEVW